MKISLVIPAYNEEKVIGPCLESVGKQGANAFVEIIVVDNASCDRTAHIASAFTRVKVVREARKGLSYARQRGLQEATGELLAFIDADTRLPSDWINMVRDVFARLPHVVCLSGPYSYYDGSLLLRVTLHLLWRTFAPVAYWLVGYMVVGGNFVVKTSAIRMVGGFNLDIPFYGEDTDIARRLSSVGRVLFRMRLHNYTSTRRFLKEGLLATCGKYAVNFLWPVLFHRPFTKSYYDVR